MSFTSFAMDVCGHNFMSVCTLSDQRLVPFCSQRMYLTLLQIVQFVRVATEAGGLEARAAIVDACDTLLNLLIKVCFCQCMLSLEEFVQ